MDSSPERRALSAEQRSVLVRQLGAALASAWRRENRQEGDCAKSSEPAAERLTEATTCHSA